jgi:hypothetical protein
MAVLQWGVARVALGTGLHVIGGGRKAMFVQVASASGFSMTVRGAVLSSTTDPLTTSPQFGYRNRSLAPDAAGVAGATAITADGIYEVPSGGVSLALHVTAGTATVTVVPDEG